MRAPSSAIQDDIYPASDGKPMAETQVHVKLLAALYELLEYWLKPRGIYLAGNMFLYYKEGNPKARRTPDLMAVKGVNVERKRRSFMTWVEKAAPCWVLELTSKKTAKEDRGAKRRLYRRLGVRECFMFDPLSDYLPQQLMGFRLSGSIYQPLQTEDDGGLTSKELGLRFVPDGNDLLVLEAKTGKQLLDYGELQAELERRRQASDTRIAELEAELARAKSAPKGKSNGRR